MALLEEHAWGGHLHGRGGRPDRTRGPATPRAPRPTQLLANWRWHLALPGQPRPRLRHTTHPHERTRPLAPRRPGSRRLRRAIFATVKTKTNRRLQDLGPRGIRDERWAGRGGEERRGEHVPSLHEGGPAALMLLRRRRLRVGRRVALLRVTLLRWVALLRRVALRWVALRRRRVSGGRVARRRVRVLPGITCTGAARTRIHVSQREDEAQSVAETRREHGN